MESLTLIVFFEVEGNRGVKGCGFGSKDTCCFLRHCLNPSCMSV